MVAMPAACASRGLEMRLGAVETHGPGVPAVDPGEDLDQGRFAGTVLADQRVDLTGSDMQGRARERGHAVERLVDGVHLSRSVTRPRSLFLRVVSEAR